MCAYVLIATMIHLSPTCGEKYYIIECPTQSSGATVQCSVARNFGYVKKAPKNDKGRPQKTCQRHPSVYTLILIDTPGRGAQKYFFFAKVREEWGTRQ